MCGKIKTGNRKLLKNKMAGLPAGFEDDLSDDDFDFNDEAYREYYDNINENTNSAAQNEQNFVDLIRTNYVAVEEQLSIKSEDFRIAILENHKSYIEEVLNQGFQADTILKSGWSGIFYAATNGHFEIVCSLVEHKASVNMKCDSFTPLMALCQSSKKREEELLVKCADYLIQKGAEVNDHDKHLMTPLMYACKQGYAKLVKLLCDHEALKNLQETRGWTAISFAASNGFSHVVRVLLECGSDHDITTFDGQKPMDLAFSNGYSMLSDLLEKYDGTNAAQIENAPLKSSTLTKPSPKFVNYGDLELFLFGLELGHLVPIFQEHHLSFSQMLGLTEEELVEVGVDQLGARKKLYCALQDVRTNEWDTLSLSMESMAKLSTLETAAVIGNVAKHLECLQSCVTFVQKMVKRRRKELTADNRNLQKTMLQQCDVACKMSRNLNEEMSQLNVMIVKLFPDAEKRNADLIEYPNKNVKMSKLKIITGLGFIGLGYRANDAAY